MELRPGGDTETRSAVAQTGSRVMLLQPLGSDFYMLPNILRIKKGLAD